MILRIDQGDRKSGAFKYRLTPNRSAGIFTLTVFSLLLIAFLSSHTPSPIAIAQDTGNATLLVPGTPVSTQIASGAIQTYEIGLSRDQCLRLNIQKNDLNLRVTVQSVTPEMHYSFLNRKYGPFEVFHIAKTDGRHVISVQSLETTGPDGSYVLSVSAPTDSTAFDRTYEAASTASNEAEMARAEWQEPSLRKAISKYLEASKEWQRIDRQLEAAQSFTNIGDLYSILSQYDLALQSYQQALAIRRRAGDRAGEIDSLNEIGYAQSYLVDNEKALDTLNQALHYAETKQTGVENRRRMARTLNNLGEVYYAISELQKSFDHFNRALAIWKEVGDRAGQSLAHINLGYSFYDSGDIQNAAENYQRALTLRLEIDDRRGEALARTAIGGVYSLMGEKQQALDWHNRATTLLRTIGDHLGEAASSNGIGKSYEDLNQNQLALDSYLRAQDLNQRAGKSDYEALSYYYIGRVYRSLADLPAALKFYEQCASHSRQVKNYRFEAYALKDMAIIYNTIGQRERALEGFEKVLKFFRKAEDKRGEAYALSGLGYTWLLLGQPTRALEYFEQALPLSKLIQDRSAEISFLYHMSLAKRAQGDLNHALTDVQESIRVIESMRTKVGSRDLRASYFASVQQHYELYIDLLMQLDQGSPAAGFAAKAFEISEQAKARSLLDSLTEARLDLSNQSDPAVSERLVKLRQSLNVKAELQMLLLNGKHTPEAAAQADKELREIRADYDQAEAQLRSLNASYAALSEPKFLSLQDVQSQLPDANTVLLEFALGDDRSYLWLVSSSSIIGYQIPNRKTLEEAAGQVSELLTARQPVTNESAAQYQQRVAQSDAQYFAQAAKLSWMLLGPVQNEIQGKRLLITADGALHYLPFGALPTPANPDSTTAGQSTANEPNVSMPLAVAHEIVRLPSASVLAAVRRDLRTRGSRMIVILADPVFSKDDPRMTSPSAQPPATTAETSELREGAAAPYVNRLPATLREAEAIIKLVPKSEGALITGFEANHDLALSQELSHYRIVHFATHGVIDPEHPELSGVILSLVDRQGKQQDGFLRLHEIYNFRLAADLVVLSACQTALGKNLKGEGLIGLTRGFMYAGSKSVVATLWKVDDEATTEFMKHFYNALLVEHLPPSLALKNAKTALWSQKRWRSPYFWAAFELHGEYQQPIGMIQQRHFSFYLLWLGVIAICLTASYYLWRRFRRKSVR